MAPLTVSTSQSKSALKTSEAKLWMLLVGVNQYQDNNLPSLQYSALDCQGLGEALVEATQGLPQKEIISHHDFAPQLPTLETVRVSLQRIIASATSQDTVLFYFSGHGLIDSQSQQVVLCLQNTQKDEPFKTGLSVSELLQLLDNCQAHQQLVWLDACHSGDLKLRGSIREIESGQNYPSSAFNPTSQLVEVLQKRAAQSQRFYALLSCDRSQQSWEFPQLGHGVFTYYLIRGLRGEAANSQGIIEADGLYKYVYYQTLQYIDKTNQQIRLINQQKRSRGTTELQPEYPQQTPKRIVEGVGEIILGLKPAPISSREPRLALAIDGLSGGESSLAFSKKLRQAGQFKLEYWHRQRNASSDVSEAIQTCLREAKLSQRESHSSIQSERDSHFNRLSDREPDTSLLYLRGRTAQTEAGEACLVFADEVRISRSWLRQELRRSTMAQQIVILDCPGAQDLSEWVEDLQIDNEQGQCLIAAATPAAAPEQFTQALLETLVAVNPQVGLPIAGWISQLQVYLAGTEIKLNLWLSGARGIIEVIPGKLNIEDTDRSADLGLCPYKGLQSFGEEDAQFFYGRETLTQQLINQLARQSFLAVVGASGSGKSSVIHAGLIAQLSQGKQLPGSERWWIKSVRPGNNPLEALSWQMVDERTEPERTQKQMQLEGTLYLGVEGFVRWLRSRPEPMVVLVIDQFEELFTLANAEDRKRYLEIILGALEYASDRFKLVLALRVDFISSCLEVPLLARALQRSSVLVPPYLTPEDYSQAIIMPAQKVGLRIEPELVEVLLQELDRSAGELPLLEFVLEQLWENRRAGQLTLEAYQHKIGGIKGALERKAQTVYESLDSQSQACAQWIFLALTQLGEGKEDTRRRAIKSELIVKKYPQKLVERTLQALSNAKLIVINLESGEDLAGQSRQAQIPPSDPEDLVLQKMKQEVTVEVTHEVLIRYWSTLRWWLEENRARLRVQRQLIHSALLWKQSGQHSDFLLQGVRLAEAEELYIKYADELSEDVQRFIEACLAERDRQERQTKRRLQQAQTAVAIISFLTIGALGLGGLAYWQSQMAKLMEIEALKPLSGYYLLSHQQFDALLISVKAARQLQKVLRYNNILTPHISAETQSETLRNLRQAAYEIQEYNRLEQHTDEVFSVAFSPDGEIIASASADNTVKLWRRDGQIITTLKGHNDGVWGVSFSPDGKLIASASEDKTVKLWRTSDGKLLRTLTGHQKGVNSIRFSPDGQTIASASKDKTVKLWRTSDGKLLKNLTRHNDVVFGVSFSPDGKLIASASADKTIKLWQSNDGKLIKNLTDTAAVWGVSFSPDGKLIASASADKTIKLWRSDDGSLVRSLPAHDDGVNSITFSPNGQIIASTSRDNTIKLWRSSSGSLLAILQGHSASVQSASFSPDGQTIASASSDKTIKLWKISHTNLSYLLQGHKAMVNSVSFSPDGQILASASDDNTIKLWKSNDGYLIKTLQERPTKKVENKVESVVFSPDGQLIASANDDKTIKLWRTRDSRSDPYGNRSLIKILQGHKAAVKSVTFSPDGETIASASRDKTIKLWRTRDSQSDPYGNRSLIKTLEGHTDGVESVAFSPNGQYIASASRDKTIKLWQTSDGQLLHTFKGHSGQVNGVSFSPDGQTIASVSEDKTIKIWSYDGTLLRTLDGHNGYVWGVSFSPDGQTLASASEDKTVKLWRSRDGHLLQTLDGYKAAVSSVNFSPDGHAVSEAMPVGLIASASLDNTIKLWQLDTTQLQASELDFLLNRACNWLHDYLKTNTKASQQERQLCLNLWELHQ